MNYLVIDDDPAFCQVLERSLIRRGHCVQTAQTELAALGACQDNPFDRAIVDLKLQETSGLHLIEKLKAIQPELDILILTGYSSINTAVEAIKLGAVNYLCKPADTNDIENAFDSTTGNASSPVAEKPPSVNRLEWEHIQKVLAEHEGNISATARALGMHRRTLQRKLLKRPVKN